ncbi:hypothetical protein SELMODRAFT_404278 [Selaginella moellendorffii]|uniref:DUF4371 domain-containing protein n=1 Tax=Selaginella moellendorffii TaxID=88036 RepID=D8QUU4_SELML|nr:hypothetical protein SELMODRAFT_404278 [Selaginella moellendorffii]
MNIPRYYNSDKGCSQLITSINKVIVKNILQKVRESPYFGLKVDESTDISIMKHLIFYVIYIMKMNYLGIVSIDDSGVASFGSDGCNVMAGSSNLLQQKLKKKFQEKLIDITIVGPLCQETIMKLNQYYISDEIDLNGNLMDSKSYPYIPDGGRKQTVWDYKGIVDPLTFMEEYLTWKLLALEEWKGQNFIDI